MTLTNFIDFSRSHGKSSAKFLTKFEGTDIYVGISEPAGKMRGYPMLMKEVKDKIVTLNHKEIIKVLRSLPNKD